MESTEEILKKLEVLSQTLTAVNGAYVQEKERKHRLVEDVWTLIEREVEKLR